MEYLDREIISKAADITDTSDAVCGRQRGLLCSRQQPPNTTGTHFGQVRGVLCGGLAVRASRLFALSRYYILGRPVCTQGQFGDMGFSSRKPRWGKSVSVETTHIRCFRFRICTIPAGRVTVEHQNHCPWREMSNVITTRPCANYFPWVK